MTCSLKQEEISKLKEIACSAIEAASGDLYTLSQEIWKNPETAFKEERAHKILTEFFQSRFPEVERNYHLPTAFRIPYQLSDPGPHVAVLCEYDALPEIGHACGHNLIAEVGVATGLGIKAAIESSKKNGYSLGKLTILGTPAEEDGCGKGLLIKAGTFDGVDVAMMAHPSIYNLLRPNYIAIVQMTITYTGVQAHAAEWPWEGVNALDAAVSCYVLISNLRQQIPPKWMIHGIITKGGARPNIIPANTEMEYYLRAPTEAELDMLKSKVTNCAKGAALSTGCKVDYSFTMPDLSLITNDSMIKAFDSNATHLGMEITRDKTIVDKVGGSSDMGNVSHVVPSIHPEFYIGTDEKVHTQEFTPAAGDEKAQPYTIRMAKALAMTAIDVYTDQHLLANIKQDFQKDMEKEREIERTGSITL